MIQNIIQLDPNKSLLQSGSLVINGNRYELPDSFQVYNTKQEYEDTHSKIEQVQTHFDGQIAYIKDIHVIIIGGNIDNLSDQIAYSLSQNSDSTETAGVNDFESFIKKISAVATGPFKIATICWEEIGVAVYYMNFDGVLESVRLDFDAWEETDFFKKIATELEIDTCADDFYDDDENHEEMKSPCQQVCDEIHENHLQGNITLLAPSWY
jgi:hypothetical protein